MCSFATSNHVRTCIIPLVLGKVGPIRSCWPDPSGKFHRWLEGLASKIGGRSNNSSHLRTKLNLFLRPSLQHWCGIDKPLLSPTRVTSGGGRASPACKTESLSFTPIASAFVWHRQTTPESYTSDFRWRPCVAPRQMVFVSAAVVASRNANHGRQLEECVVTKVACAVC